VTTDTVATLPVDRRSSWKNRPGSIAPMSQSECGAPAIQRMDRASERDGDTALMLRAMHHCASGAHRAGDERPHRQPYRRPQGQADPLNVFDASAIVRAAMATGGIPYRP
jgi:hypothetical protein